MKTKYRGDDRLKKANAALARAQKFFFVQLSESNRQISESKRQIAEIERINSECFRRIEAILFEHTRILQALPEVIREIIGFKPP